MSFLPKGIMVVALCAVGGLAAVGLAPMPPTPTVRPTATPAMTPEAAAPALPNVDPSVGLSLLSRSPFAHDRSPFTRNVLAQPALEVRLAGISTVSGKKHATIVVGTQTLVVAKGDATPVGNVETIETDAVVIAGPPERRLELFKQ